MAHLGFRTVDQLEEEMSADEFERWVYLRYREPWGPYRLDFLCGLIRHSIHCQWATKENPPPGLDKLIPTWDAIIPKTREELEAEAEERWEKSVDRLFDQVD